MVIPILYQYHKKRLYLLQMAQFGKATSLKDFQGGLMVDMASKNISICTVSSTALPMKLNWFALSANTVLATKFPTNSALLCFSENSSKPCCIDITFSKMCRAFKRHLGGRPFDPEEGAWQIWSGEIIHFHYGLGRKIYFQVNWGHNIYFQPQQTFEKRGGGVSARVWQSGKGSQIWLSMFCISFCRLLHVARHVVYLVAGMFWYWSF